MKKYLLLLPVGAMQIVLIALIVILVNSCSKEKDCQTNTRDGHLATLKDDPWDGLDPDDFGVLHNRLYDTLAYNWSNINSAENPQEYAVDLLLAICDSEFNISLSAEYQEVIRNAIIAKIRAGLNANGGIVSYFNLRLQEHLDTEYLPVVFSVIDSLQNETSLDQDSVTLAIDELNDYIDLANISEDRKIQYKILTSVFMYSLEKAYEMNNDLNHPFHSYTVEFCLGCWLVADAYPALEGALEGAAAGAPAGPWGAATGAVLGGVITGALASAVSTAMTDLASTWF